MSVPLRLQIPSAAHMQGTHFLNDTKINLLFYCHIILLERKLTYFLREI